MPLFRQPEPSHHPHTALRTQHLAAQASTEAGFILLWVLFLAVLLLIALAVAAPRVAVSLQRQKELELVHRGQQYQRAIQLYYRKFGTYPSSIKQLLDTDNIRFLRKRYKDPLTGKDDWRIIHLGQAKVPPMGFFGKPLTGLNGPASIGTSIGGAAGTPASGMSGTSGFGNSAGASTFGSSTMGSSGFGSSGFGSSGFGSPGFGNNTATSPTGSNSDSTDSSSGSKTDAAGFSNGNTGKDAAGFSSKDESGSNLGGGPIVGVGVPVPKPSLVAYKKQTHYNQWEFVYFPIEDQMRAAAAALNGGVQSQSGTSNSNDNGFGNLMGNGTNGTNGTGTGLGSFGSGSSNFGSTNFGSGSGSSGTGSSPNSNNQSQDQQQ